MFPAIKSSKCPNAQSAQARNEIVEKKRINRIRKPEGVYILCLLIFLNFGFYQFIQDFNAMQADDKETPLLIAVILISLDVFCAVTAIWTFLGDNLGRIFLLTFVTLNMLWSVFILILIISYDNFDRDKVNFLLSLIKPLIIFGICWWYFTTGKVTEYYKQGNFEVF